MRSAALAMFVLLHALPARAAIEVGADAGAFAARSRGISFAAGAVTPHALVGGTAGWRFSDAHWLGVGFRFRFPTGVLPVARVQYALDFDLADYKATIPVSFGMAPLVDCEGTRCSFVPEVRAGFGVQLWDMFIAPWLSVEAAVPLGVSGERFSPMLGLHLSVRWEPTPEAAERDR